jgi:hypothetical protein
LRSTEAELVGNKPGGNARIQIPADGIAHSLPRVNLNPSLADRSGSGDLYGPSIQQTSTQTLRIRQMRRQIERTFGIALSTLNLSPQQLNLNSAVGGSVFNDLRRGGC